MNEIEAAVLRIFRNDLAIEVPDAETDVIETGLLDSLALVTLVYELEQQLGIEIPFEDLEVEDFRSVRSITGLVEARGGSAS